MSRHKKEFIRCFLGIEIPDNLKEKIYKFVIQLRTDNIKASWVKKENYHITFKFLGEITQSRIERVDKIISKIRPKSAFEIKLTHCGVFPSIEKPRVLWLGIEENPEIVNTFNQIDSSLVKAGFEKEKRKFVPHITLARIKYAIPQNVNDFIQNMNKKLKEISQPVKIGGIILYKSVLSPQGSIYTPIKKY